MPDASRLFIGLLLLGIGVAGSYLVLRADLQRRKLSANAVGLAACVAVAAIALSAMLEVVASTLAPGVRLFWTGICLGGFATSFALLLRIARGHGMALLSILDAGSCAAAIGYAGFNLGISVTGEGPSGTAVLNAVAGFLIGAFLWQRGKRAILRPLAPGVIAGEFFALIGFSRILAEAVRIKVQIVPSASAGLLVALLIAVSGIALSLLANRYFRKADQVHRILRHVSLHGSEPQAEYHRPTPECPHPERWRMFDTMTAEVEVLEFLRTLVTTIKPDFIVETGTFLGVSTLYMAEGLKQNGFGRILTCESDADVFAAAQAKFAASGLGAWIEARQVSSLDLEVSAVIDFLFSDSLPELREQEVRRFLPMMKPGGLVLMHDASSHLKTVREAALKLEREGLISVVLLPTPRGLVVGQKRSGRD